MTKRPRAPVGTALQAQDELSRATGALFRQHREKHGHTLTTLAERMERTINVIRHHEAGYRMMRTDDLIRAAAIIGVSPATLLPSSESAKAMIGAEPTYG